MWVKENFSGSEYVMYRHNGEEKFVARFKHGNKRGFMSFLKKNFTPDEYFAMRESTDMAPAKILETKGYVCDNVKKILKMYGYEQTQAGLAQYLDMRRAEREAA